MSSGSVRLVLPRTSLVARFVFEREMSCVSMRDAEALSLCLDPDPDQNTLSRHVQ